MKMANAIEAVRSEEMGLKIVPRSTLIDKVNSTETYRETDQYPTWSETSVAQYSQRTCQLLSDAGTKILGINKKYYKNGL
jgi:hypothetical protein